MRSFVLAAALALAACSPTGCTPAAEKTADQSADDAANGCAVSASAPWTAGGETITIEGATTGADCASAEASIAFRRGDAEPFYQENFSASQVMTLAGANSAADMQQRLQEWVTPGPPDSTGDLPEWPANADGPSGEFPFHPYNMDRATYEAHRAADTPMFCFVRGMESQACFTLDNGAWRHLGLQQFPG
jgi:hypothetical protein